MKTCQGKVQAQMLDYAAHSFFEGCKLRELKHITAVFRKTGITISHVMYLQFCIQTHPPFRLYLRNRKIPPMISPAMTNTETATRAVSVERLSCTKLVVVIGGSSVGKVC